MIALVTGTSSGIGTETARALEARGFTVVHGTRAEGLDLADLATVDAFATRVLAEHDRIDLLVNNAGVMACPFGRTADGFERQFGTNHLGHFLLTNLLLPAIVAAAPGARIVNLSSRGHQRSDIHWDDPNYERRPYDKWEAYGQSKTANILHALELDTRLGPEGIHAFSVHPGLVATKLGRHLTRDDLRALMERVRQSQEAATGAPAERPVPRDPAIGAATQVWCAVSEDLDGHGGAYCEDLHVSLPMDEAPPGEGYARYARDPASAVRLWELSERLVGS